MLLLTASNSLMPCRIKNWRLATTVPLTKSPLEFERSSYGLSELLVGSQNITWSPEKCVSRRSVSYIQSGTQRPIASSNVSSVIMIHSDLFRIAGN
jgi:hypothetical protein